MTFHAQHKLLIMSHSQDAVREMGRLLADAGKRGAAAARTEYEAMLLKALKRLATPKKHANVLQHMLGYFKEQLSAEEKQEMLSLIRDMREGVVPLIVPITMFNHYVRKYEVEYLIGQWYLNPHPLELKLRNHA
jgi:uncharacterized protein YbgA (DUF1722 family)